MCNMIKLQVYKIKQIQIFFRFLKDLGIYKTYVDCIKDKYYWYTDYQRELPNRKISTFKEFIYDRLYSEPPFRFLYFFKYSNEDLIYADMLWLYHIISSQNNTIFDSVDVDMAKRRLRTLDFNF